MQSLSFLGAGAMGEALIRGLLQAEVLEAGQISAYDADAARVQAVARSLGVRALSRPEECGQSQVIVVAVKPQVLGKALEPLRDLSPESTVVSIAAGVTLAQLEACFVQDVPVVRVMPNTPALVLRAASALAPGSFAKAEHLALAHEIFDAVGVAVDVDEKLLDAVTGLSGSGPAYVYVLIEALSDGGVRAGLPRDVATKLAAQTVLGSAQMVLETGEHPGSLKDKVTSPGGTTIAGLHALENHGFRGALIDAVQAATQRAKELSGS
jgi:pyrroline-5-carboxylate reductase